MRSAHNTEQQSKYLATTHTDTHSLSLLYKRMVREIRAKMNIYINFIRSSINTIKSKTVKCRYFEFTLLHTCKRHKYLCWLYQEKDYGLHCAEWNKKKANCEWARNLTVLLLLLLLTFQRHEVETNLNSACRHTTNGAIVVLHIGFDQIKITTIAMWPEKIRLSIIFVKCITKS